MISKIVKSLALIAMLAGSAFGTTIQLQVFPSSNNYWLAVDPLNEAGSTSMIEVQEASSSSWNAMAADSADWGFYTLSSSSSNGFNFPLSFRFTDTAGSQVVASNVLTSASAGSAVDTGVNFGVASVAPSTPNCGSSQPATSAPTTKPTTAPTTKPTTAPTTKPTTAPTTPATQAPSSSNHHGSSSGSSTQKPTSAPTTKPTSAPTTKPTTKPTSAPTTKPTSAPTTKPTTAPTTKPTSAPTTKPTTAPTTKPASSGSSSSGSSTDLCTVTSTSSEPLQLLVPLYVYPGAAWDQVIAAAASGVKIVAIINPNSGPDSAGPDSSYKTYMTKLTNAGIDMVGYVHTSYGERAISDVTTDISTYASKYTGLKGIFIDEASDSSSELSYYQSVYTAITSHSGYTNAILNPGTQPDQGYLAVSTNIVIFENAASSLKSNFASWVSCAPSASEKAGYKYKFSGIAYGASQSTMATTLATMKSAGMGMVYVTDGASGCCTYNTLVSYMAAEATAVAALN